MSTPQDKPQAERGTASFLHFRGGGAPVTRLGQKQVKYLRSFQQIEKLGVPVIRGTVHLRQQRGKLKTYFVSSYTQRPICRKFNLVKYFLSRSFFRW